MLHPLRIWVLSIKRAFNATGCRQNILHRSFKGFLSVKPAIGRAKPFEAEIYFNPARCLKLSFKLRFKDLARATVFHLFLPTFIHIAFADGAVDKPAEITRLILPRRAMLAPLLGAFNPLPTR